MMKSKSRRVQGTPPKSSRTRAFLIKYGPGYVLLSPFMILFLIFVVIPVVISFYLSFTDSNMLEAPNWVGLQNYELLVLEDDLFLKAMANTLIFACISGPISFFMSFIMAWVINQIKRKTFFSLAFYAPTLTSGIALSAIWLYFFGSDRMGLINNFLLKIGLINEPILWTMNSKTIMPVVIIISVWMGMGNGFLAFLTGLQNMPEDLYEAGMIDGIRNKFQELIYITLPQMKPQLLFGAINATVAAFGVFDIAVAVAGMPSPDYAAHTIVAHIYDYAFIRYEMGYASVVAVVLFLLTFLLGRIFTRVFSSKDI